MNKDLLKIAIRYNSIYIESSELRSVQDMSPVAATFWANMSRIGYTAEESLAQAVNSLLPKQVLVIYETFTEVLQLKNNWAPLVRGWDIPTGESSFDHLITLICNVFNVGKGVRLACGHLIPENSFPLERYNGCPFCGKQFDKAMVAVTGQGSKLKVLSLWSEVDMQKLLSDLLQSKTPLDATQAHTLKILLANFEMPDVVPAIKETLILVIHNLIKSGKSEAVAALITSPVDIMRYLWYRKTGALQLMEPKTLLKRIRKNNKHFHAGLDTSSYTGIKAAQDLKLKYGRAESRMVAQWINDLSLTPEQCCEQMHPKRSMWVRFIRALRLAEYSKKPGYEKLAEIIDRFYRGDYTVWNERVSHFRLKYDKANTFELLKQRPGLFARSLFSNMLWFGAEDTLAAFSEVTEKLPARLVLTLKSYAENYFISREHRLVSPLGGIAKIIEPHQLLRWHNASQLREMTAAVEAMALGAMEKRYANQVNANATIFIDKSLFNLPLSIGDRNESIMDLPAALMGTRFTLEGNAIRLFMQWGRGLSAQHLDMDLSCHISYAKHTDVCSFSSLVVAGAKHSGDIRQIPEMVGTAEYIELDVSSLQEAGARYVSFTCNAYSTGSITPNLVLGWMDSKNPMHISATTGVAYDPSCVQHQLRVTSSITKGLVFGVLDVQVREIIWLELPFDGQVIGQLNIENVERMISRLKSKFSVGALLQLKARAQKVALVNNIDEADEKYDMKWAMNTARVTELLID